MANTAYRYFTVEGGALLDKAKALRAEHEATHKILAAFANQHGAKGYYCTGGGFSAGREAPRLFALTPVHPLPPGWKLSSRRNCMEPYAKEKELKEAIKALPALPNIIGEISAAIGWETRFPSSTDPGRVYGRPPCQMIWTNDRFCICAPLHGQLGGMSDDTIQAAMALPVPDGCREITQAEWELISATENAEREKAGKAA